MLRVNQIKLKYNHSDHELDRAVHKALRLAKNEICEYAIFKKSIDSRHKPDIYAVYSVDITDVYVADKNKHKDGSISDGKISERISASEKSTLNNRQRKISGDIIIKRAKNKNIVKVKDIRYEFPVTKIQKDIKEEDRPVVIGFGPAGMFAALKLARAGFRPVVYERGQSIADRKKTVDIFWNGGILDTESNVQFGEGGAGTFSDGKLNTVIKDPTGRIREVLRTFVEYGADGSIMYINKPHIGTDVLAVIVKNMREEIIRLGGEVVFNSRLDDITVDNGKITNVVIKNTKTGSVITRPCKNVCLSIGHSARDTFYMLKDRGFNMQAKSFAVGMRLEHPQEFINYNAYMGAPYRLPAADYKVTYQTQSGRGVYSFCMCPGGYVVNASSENGMTAVNGMSYSGRDGKNANSAIIVTVTPDDFGEGVLAGVEYQRRLEKHAYREGQGNIPVQLVSDFKLNRVSTGFGKVVPQIKGKYTFGNMNNVLGVKLCEAIKEAMAGFDHKIKGFDMEDAVFSGVESRTSSPVRIVRNELLESDISGVFPCGEGAGYAGGITSAAVDGIKVAEKIAQKISAGI